MTREQIAAKILDAITGRKFELWYRMGDFDKFLCDGTVKRETILKQIVEMFELNGVERQVNRCWMRSTR